MSYRRFPVQRGNALHVLLLINDDGFSLEESDSKRLECNLIEDIHLFSLGYQIR